MLEAVVEEMDGLSWLGRLGQHSGAVAVCADPDGQAGAGEEEGFVAEGFGGALGVDAFGGGAGSTVASAEHVDCVAFAGEQLGEGEDDWGFARASGGEAADADYGLAQVLGAGFEAALGPEGGGVEVVQGE